MARTKKKNGAGVDPTPGPGHNANADQEAADLTVYYQLKIIEALRKVDAIAVDLKGARDVVNGHFKRMTGDLKFTRKDFQAEVIDKLNMTEAEFRNAEIKRARMHRLAGLRPGEQADMFEHVLNDTVDEENEAEANGYRAGFRGDDPTPPKTVAPIMHPKWMEGWHRGQTERGERFIRAQEIIAAKQAKKPELQPEPESQQHEIDPEAQIKEDAKRLAESGWMEPRAEETILEDAAA